MKRLLALVLLAAAPASAIKVERIGGGRALPASGGEGGIEVVAAEALVRFDPSIDRPGRESAMASRGMRFLRDLHSTMWSHVALPPGMPVESGLAFLRTVPGVLEAAPNHVFRANRIPNDLSYPNQYHLGTINAPAAWDFNVGDSTRVTVAVIDAGIEGTHPDLSGKFFGNSQFCSPGGDLNIGTDNSPCVDEAPPVAACNHGTRVAGVAAAASNNGIGVAGVSWGAGLLSARVFRTQDCNAACCSAGGDCSNFGNTCGTDETAISDALHKVTSFHNSPTYGKIVANISLGFTGCPGSPNCPACPALLQTAINVAVSSGVTVVVAGGNEGGFMRPLGNCVNVIPVGATDVNDNVASFSNSGPELAANGVVAPGVSLVTTDVNGGTTGGATGTSFSAPLVSGLASLIWSARPDLTPAQVKERIRGGAQGIGVSAASLSAALPSGNSTGAGRVNAFRTMKLTVEGTLAGFTGDQKVIAFPNPFRPNEAGAVTITIPPSLAGKGANLRIFTIDGQLVRDLKAQTSWDGKNDHGKNVATGVYIILVKTDAGMARARVAVIR